MNVDLAKWMYFRVDEFEVGVNDTIFSGNEQQKVQFNSILKSWRVIFQWDKFDKFDKVNNSPHIQAKFKLTNTRN